MKWWSVWALALVLAACGGDVNQGGPTGDGDGDGDGVGDGDGDGDGGDPTDPDSGPPAGNPNGGCEVPAEAQAEDTSSPDHVVGTGTPASCTSAAFVDAVAQGGVITFDCGPDPVTIELEATAKVFNDKGPRIVIDGGGKVTLSGKNERRILYQNTCDEAQVWTTASCDNQDHPQLTVQNLTFVDGFAQDGGQWSGGGAIFASGGRLKIVKSRFFHNQAVKEGSDVGGGAVIAYQQFEGQPIYVVDSTFGAADAALGNEAASGGALRSIGVSWTVINSVIENNRAVGEGDSGGGICVDGNTFTLSLCGVTIRNNQSHSFGAAIFMTSNDRTGHLIIRDSTLSGNVSGDPNADQYPGIFVLQQGEPEITNSTVE